MTLPRNAETARFVDHHGCRLGFSIAGAGAPVLFIQGTAIHGDGWRPQLEDLAVDHRCLWFDNRGMGVSQPRGDAAIDVAQLADDARAVLDAAGWDSAHVVGHSLGGVIAQELALTARHRVRSLALLCTAARGPALVAMDRAMIWRGLRMSVGTRRARRRAFLEIILAPDHLARIDRDALAIELEPIFGHDLAVRPPVTMKQVGAMRRWDATARLGELAGVPTLVVGARHDLIARPPLVRALADGIPGARRVEIDDAAHGVTVTHAATVNALLRAHLAAAGGAEAS